MLQLKNWSVCQDRDGQDVLSGKLFDAIKIREKVRRIEDLRIGLGVYTCYGFKFFVGTDGKRILQER